MKIAVTGKEKGNVRDTLVSLGVIPVNADILDEDSLNDELQSILPDVVIHAAAMTDVDACELDYKKAFQTNVRGTMYVAEACNRVNARMVYLSTCHVFDGTKKEPYVETSRTNPKNVYGFTKWTGEVITHSTADKFLIVRISKLFTSGGCRQYLHSPHKVVPTFIHRNYTHVDHFCDMLLDVINRPFYGDKFLLNLGAIHGWSGYTFFTTLYDSLRLSRDAITHRDKEDFSYVPRPFNGVLDMSLAINSGVRMYSTLDGILKVVEDLRE